MKLVSVRLLVSDFDVCFRFYRDIMKLEATFGAEGEGYASFKTEESSLLELFPRAEMAAIVGAADLPTQVPAQDRVLISFSVPDVNATVEELRAQGVSILVEPTDRADWGVRAAQFRDPDSNLIELYTHLSENS